VTESSCLSSLSVSILGSVAAGLYPTLLPARPGSPRPGLDIYNAAAPEGTRRIALAIYMFGMMLVGVCLANIYRLWRGKVKGMDH
jgi:cytochrome bd-type quinol oxidase subunit 2